MPRAAPAAPRRSVEIDTGVRVEAAPAPEVPAEEPPPEFAGFRMLGAAEISAELRAQLLEKLAKISLPPRSLQELLSPEFLASGTSRELAEFILREPVLAAKILARVNSPYYGLQSPIDSVQRAITFLGMNAVRNMALQFMVEESFRSEEPALQALYGSIWDAGMIAADLCVLLSQKLGFSESGASSTQTVLSFVGDFAVLTLLPADAALASWQHALLQRTRMQQEVLGLNASVAGSLLMRAWGLPDGITAGVEDIGALLVTPAPTTADARALRLALCYVCARIGEAIAMGRVQDPAQVDPAAAGSAELHYVQTYLRRPEFARLAEHLHAPDARLALARMIAASGARQRAG